MYGLRGNSMSYGIEGQMGQIQIVQDVARAIATATGLRDPISHYEPGVPLPEVWAKYDAQVDQFLGQIPTIRSGSAQKDLMAQMQKCAVIRDRLKVAFGPGSTIGERDRERLAELVYCVREFRKNWNDAYAKYGTGPVPGAIMKPGEFAAPSSGIPLPIIIAAAGFLLSRFS
jgi:hypothetical protein